MQLRSSASSSMQLRSGRSVTELPSGSKSSTSVKSSSSGQSLPASRTASNADIAVPQEPQAVSNVEAPSRRVTRSLTAKARQEAAAIIAPGSLQEQEEEDEYEVEKIVAKYVGKKGLFYLIKWVGYSEARNTWEPVSNLTKCGDLIEEFERTVKEMEDKARSSLGCKRSRNVEDNWDEEEDDSGESKKRSKC